MTKMDFSRTMDKALVHRVAVAEVFVTGAVAAAEGEYRIGVQVPRHHGMYGDALHTTGRYDPMFFLEACRQSTYVVVHLFHDVPLDRNFILRDVAVRVVDSDLLAIGETPTEAVLHVRVQRQFRNRDRALTGMRVGYQVVIDGRVAVECELSASWITAREHDALRTRSREDLGLGARPTACPAARRAPAELVNRRVPLNVVISRPVRDDRGGHRAALIADTTHPSLFDHPLDHLPGMLEVEACRQLALASLGPGWRLDRLSARFREFAEFDLPTHCVTDLPEPQDGDQDGVRVPVRVVQAGRTVLEAEVGLVRVPDTADGTGSEITPMALVASR
ncbi:ScbA/BarX family gamma-butyrolactone biosynthesis protein [Kutzneria viridogrisea]|uniref:A-factor biosynthesis hotdog domain-containing protein n=2 Tax=Kutzneria TaxID=43356 RepID=W5WEC6_9PSEU|nr:ScbA/BarX family gamma-butyrolactone biosynthesis protein [Kutzneria albida]AHH99172.1 hypothetical protein KALB_5811 [Kutzneria albida DSM 43870]MBA8923275.1 hypothetical protein [Kutzneria viridogrisea]